MLFHEVSIILLSQWKHMYMYAIRVPLRLCVIYLYGISCECAGGWADWNSSRTHDRNTVPAAWETSASLITHGKEKHTVKQSAEEQICKTSQAQLSFSMFLWSEQEQCTTLMGCNVATYKMVLQVVHKGVHVHIVKNSKDFLVCLCFVQFDLDQVCCTVSSFDLWTTPLSWRKVNSKHKHFLAFHISCKGQCVLKSHMLWIPMWEFTCDFFLRRAAERVHISLSLFLGRRHFHVGVFAEIEWRHKGQ